MQLFNRIPNENELSLNHEISEELIKQLYLPFSSEQEANTFWQTCSTYLIAITTKHDIELVKQVLSTQFRAYLKETLNNPEFVEKLNDELSIYLLVTQDSGGGIYVLISETNKAHFISSL
ncbi:hypothetical protein NCCP2140_31570 [Pseudoalteromonas sp. NCCP-2140]|uniref:hypothetical protein n=1 Tax=Pseudoalteromonas sp. NCCP-2140 TaxID=2942288 RepID=UPI0020426992|nr:hypothetical protein [Pseudoalteromonas sp. NCCP-2140]GKW54104.1 hypothetical protein NCCP2140_31570 [Pseudoalteromonas sp. NCCP-2140]